MAKDRPIFGAVKDTTTTTGTGTITLANSAPSQYRTFGSVLSNGDSATFEIRQQTAATDEWEQVEGVYSTTGPTLTRVTVKASSNSNNLVNFGAGTKDVYLISPQNQAGIDHQTAAFASLPAASQDGRIHLPSNGYSLYRDTGAALVPWGPLLPFTAPVDADFAWINQGGASVSTTNGGIFLNAPVGAGNNQRIRKKAAPATPYTVSIGFIPMLYPASYSSVGLAWRQSSDGKLVTLRFYFDGTTNVGHIQIALSKWTSASVFSANYFDSNFFGSLVGGPCLWARFADDGASRAVYISNDGINWMLLHAVARTDFLTADEVGFFAETNQTAGAAGINLLSWKEA